MSVSRLGWRRWTNHSLSQPHRMHDTRDLAVVIPPQPAKLGAEQRSSFIASTAVNAYLGC